MRQLYCLGYLNTAYRFYWRSMGLCYSNPPFSQFAKLLDKIDLEGARVVLYSPELDSTGENTYWRPLLDPMTLARKELPRGCIFDP